MQRFGRYVLVERIASGGMAEVWRGALIGAAGFTRPLAIKRVREDSDADADLMRMLVDEARIASTLSHPNVVAVHDLGEIDGVFFMAMEYVSGRHLGQLIGQALRAGQPIPRALALYVAREALLGLAHAHTRMGSDGRPLGIVHRDVSPQNIMVGFDGSVRVADFGIAKAERRMTQTEAGVLKGKYAYMAPEQARAEDVDARADLYAMGVVLWEMLAGQRMYSGAMETLEVLKRVAGGLRPKLEGVVPDLPPPLVELAEKSLAFSREDRFQTAEAFATALTMELGRLAPAFGASNVSAMMRALFGAAVDEEQKKLAELDSLARTWSESQLPQWTAQGARMAGVTPVDAQDVAAVTALQSPARSPTPAPASPTGGAVRMVGAGAAVMVLAAAVTYAVMRPAPVVAPVSAGAPPKVVAAPGAVAVTQVVVETVPAGAKVTVDGVPQGTAPLTLKLQRGKAVFVEATHATRKAAGRVITPSGERIMVLLDLPER